jgi:predicted nucleic acid-binding protein
VKIVIDTNVVVDLLTNRESFADAAEAVFNAATAGQIQAAITANTVTDIAYLLRKHLDREAIRAALLGLMELVEVLEVNGGHCIGAFDLPMPDYEDALLAYCAKGWEADYITTRNTKDFIESPVPALEPVKLLGLFATMA